MKEVFEAEDGRLVKPVFDKELDTFRCECKSVIETDNYSFCPWCGKKIDWSEEE